MSHRKYAAALALATGFVGLATPSCETSEADSAWWQREQERVELVQHLALKEFRLQQSGYGFFAEMEQLQVSNKLSQQQLQNLLRQRSDLNEQVRELESESKALQENFVREQRRRLTGHVFDVLVMKDGRKFQKASVTGIDDTGVAIRHQDGSARFRYSDLDEEQRLLFGLMEEKSIAAEKEELQKALAYEKWVDGRLASNLAKERKESERAKIKEQEAQAARVMTASRLASSDYVRPLAQPPKSFSRGYPFDSSFRSGGPTYRYYSYDNSNCSGSSTSRSSSRYGQTSIIDELRKQSRKNF
jgi:hypothetical protein